jgi:DNA-binding XRE family transcriptional regulator
VVLLHALEKDTEAVPVGDIELAKQRMADFKRRMDASRRRPPRAAGKDGPRRAGRYEPLIKMDKLVTVTGAASDIGPQGRAAAQAARGRARRSPAHRLARDEYAAIRALREKNWIAAHIRERRYELDLTQQEVARQAGTSHSYISKLESGEHIPTIPVLNRILAVLDEHLLIGIERRTPGQEPEREVAPAPESMSA